jgi:hypothetical protein
VTKASNVRENFDYFVRHSAAFDDVSTLDDLQILESLNGKYILPGIGGWLHYGRPIPIAGPGKLTLTEAGLRCKAYRPAQLTTVISQMLTIGMVSTVTATSIAGTLWYLFTPAVGQMLAFIGFVVSVLLLFLGLYLAGYLRKFYQSSKPLDFVLPWAHIGHVTVADPSDLFESVNGSVIQIENNATEHKMYFYPDSDPEFFVGRLKQLKEDSG